MRDPARIDRIVELLRWYWHLNPDLRLGQLISNLTPERFRVGALDQPIGSQQRTMVSFLDPFHVEDTEWEQILDSQLVNL